VIRLVIQTPTREGDVEQNADASLVDDDGLETVLDVSFFTDARATTEDGITQTEDRRGYWFDRFDDEDPDLNIGSKAWTLERATLTDDVLRKYEEAFAESVQWALDDGVFSKVEISVTRNGDNGADLTVAVYRPTAPDSPYLKTWEDFLAVH